MMARVQRMGYVILKCELSAPAPSLDWCLFLDVDGTLLELADTPPSRVVGSAAQDPVGRSGAAPEGARRAGERPQYRDARRAVRAVCDLPAAGLHGVERRRASGESRGASYLDRSLRRRASWRSRAFVEAHPGTLLEDKGARSPCIFGWPPSSRPAVRRPWPRRRVRLHRLTTCRKATWCWRSSPRVHEGDRRRGIHAASRRSRAERRCSSGTI